MNPISAWKMRLGPLSSLLLVGLAACTAWPLSATQAPLQVNPPATEMPLGTPTPSVIPPFLTAVQTKTLAAESLVTDTPSPNDPLPTETPTPLPTPTPWPFTGFGVEGHYTDATMIALMQQAGVTWTRRNALLWSLVEPTEGERQWGAVYSLEQELQAFSAQGIQVILIVRSTPRWAQKVAGHFCGPISPEKLGAFAAFMKDLVIRYSAPPYNVKYWELGNEPDVDPSQVPPDSMFGCWGNKDDEYFGGGYYAEMLRAAYPAIKTADPQAQVLIGGLLLDCDPTHPPEGQTCTSAKFLEGILRNGGGDYFDVVSFHGYPQYWGKPNMAESFPTWNPRGGIVLGKASFLREVMAYYGINKPLILTEGSLLCPERNTNDCVPPTQVFYEIQADYVTQLYIKTWADGLIGTVWYQFEGPGWRYGSLLFDNRNPKPAYDALKFLTAEMRGAAFRNDLSDQYPGLRVFEFSTSEKRIWVIWSADRQDQTMTLPEGVTRILDKYGADVPSSGGQLVVNSPLYMELMP